MRERQIQIPEELWQQILLYVYNEDYRTTDNTEKLKRHIMDKINRQIEHDYYTTYKTAPNEAQREAARQKYLDSKGVLPSFRW